MRIEKMDSGKLLGIPFSSWCKVKHYMDVMYLTSVEELLLHIDEATAAQRRYEVLAAGLKEINKVIL